MADEKEMTKTEQTSETSKPETTQEVKEEKKPIDQAEIQSLMVEVARLKRANDALASENKDWKEKYKETLSQTEIASMEKAEAEAKHQEEFEAMKKELQRNRIEKAYLSQNFTADEAARIAKAEVDNDFESRMQIFAEVEARKSKEHEAEWIKSRPPIQQGTKTEEEDSFIKGLKSVKTRF